MYCLVHGSTQGPAGWDLLAREMEGLGHTVVRADLPVNEPEASATRYAEAIAATLHGSQGAAIVVAHSASGLFLPLAPEFCQVARLVFLAAVIPTIGQSFVEQFQQQPEMLCRDWVGKDPTKDPAVARDFLFHDCDPAVLPWAISTLRLMHARQAMRETCPLEKWPAVACSYILCTDDRTLNPQWWRGAAMERLGSPAFELPGGHAPHVSRPRELAAVLVGDSGESPH